MECVVTPRAVVGDHEPQKSTSFMPPLHEPTSELVLSSRVRVSMSVRRAGRNPRPSRASVRGLRSRPPKGCPRVTQGLPQKRNRRFDRAGTTTRPDLRVKAYPRASQGPPKSHPRARNLPPKKHVHVLQKTNLRYREYFVWTLLKN